MKYKDNTQHSLRTAALALMAAGSFTLSQAQPTTNLVVAQFDAGTDPFSQLYTWWGGVGLTQEWDGTQNSPTTLGPNNPGSGSLKLSTDWSQVNTSGGPQPQLMLLNAFSGIEWNQNVTASGYYYDLNFDIMVDPASARTANGDFGHIQAFVTDANWNRIQVWDAPTYTNTGWTHVHGYIDPAAAGADTITGFALYWPWQTAGTAGAIPGTQTVWVDNIILNTNLTKPLAPPTLTMVPAAPATPGLNISSIGAAQYDRNSIATIADQSWVGSSGPVTYSVTIASYPPTNYPSYQTHIFLASSPGNETAPDWNEPNIIFLDIQNHADGTATATFRYKINEPGANTFLYSGGTLGSVTSTNGPLGTWSMTWNNDTNVTITSPAGTTFSTNLTSDIVGLFASPIVAYFGCQPNTVNDIGQTVVLSNVKTTGTPNPINDSFKGSGVDTSTWVLRASQPNDVFIPRSDNAYVLTWTLPDSHFNLQMASSINGPWTDPGLTNIAVIGRNKQVTIPKSVLPAGNSAFFRMIKPVATKLQVLMPGETAAPGTASGKTGTPTAQQAGLPFDVTVNAVDDKWNLVNYVTDTVKITTTDASASLPLDAALVNGTQKFSVMFGSAGTFTVTATDVTDASKTAGTGASTTATP
ncbi:MAG TPA: hypothetical protein VL361_06230 [Candidatus Limnocylindrales bacterium]|nr:hypothetical protein [Candidatus Limnocylindrales bacterium]